MDVKLLLKQCDICKKRPAPLLLVYHTRFSALLCGVADVHCSFLIGAGCFVGFLGNTGILPIIYSVLLHVVFLCALALYCGRCLFLSQHGLLRWFFFPFPHTSPQIA